MGIPYFFTWVVKKQGADIFAKEIPSSIDYLYFDLNALLYQVYGRFHHVEDEFITMMIKKGITGQKEKESYLIDCILDTMHDLMCWVEPRKGVYFALDGVPPRAKMEQQRQRRFKTSWTEKVDKIFAQQTQKQEQDTTQESLHFDVGQWTPGSAFFILFEERVIEWIRTKQAIRGLSHKNIVIVFSGAYHLGEGEHKIMMDIKSRVSPNETVAIYGLDADLLLLCMRMWIHVPDIWIMREDANQQAAKMEQPVLSCPSVGQTNTTPYFWVSIRSFVAGFIREIRKIGSEVKQQIMTDGKTKPYGKDIYPEKWSTESCIADIIFLYSFAGNDFLPQQPSLEIYKGGLDFLWKLYVEIRIKTGLSCIHFHAHPNTGKMHWTVQQHFFQSFMTRYSQMEIHQLKYLQNVRHSTGQMKSFTEHNWKQVAQYGVENSQFQDAHDMSMRWGFIWGNEYLRTCFEWTDWTHPNAISKYHENHFKIASTFENSNFQSNALKKAEYQSVQSFVMHPHGQKVCREYLKGLAFVFQYYWFENPSQTWYYPYTSVPLLLDVAHYIRTINSIYGHAEMQNGKTIHDPYLYPYGCEMWWKNDFPLGEPDTNHAVKPMCKPLEQLFYVLPPSKWGLIDDKLVKAFALLNEYDRNENDEHKNFFGNDHFSLMHTQPHFDTYRWNAWMNWFHTVIENNNEIHNRLEWKPIRQFRMK